MSQTKSRNAQWIIVLLLLILAAVLLRWNRPPQNTAQDEDLLRLLTAARDEMEWPGLDVKTAAQNLKTMDQALAFVKDGVAYLSYRGAWSGAEGTLRTRTANCADKSLLLQALAEQLGYETRLARTEYPVNAAPYVNPKPQFSLVAFNALRDYAKRYHKEAANSGTAPADLNSRVAAVKSELDSACAGLREFLNKQGITNLDEPLPWDVPAPMAAPDCDWIWLQARKKGEETWKDYDAVFGDLPRPGGYYESYAVPPSTLQIIVQGVNADGRPLKIVDWEGNTSQALGHEISVSFFPAKASPELLAQVKNPAEIGLWTALLQVGGQHKRGAFTPDGLVLTKVGQELRLNGQPVAALDSAGRFQFDAPPIQTLTLQSVGTDEFPRVQLELSAELQRAPRWHSGHFHLTAADNERETVRMDAAYVGKRPVAIVIDLSGSMFDDNNRIAIARTAMKSLLAQLPDDQPVALFSFAGDFYAHQAPTPLGQCRDSLNAAIDSLSARSSTYIPEAVQETVKNLAQPSYVVFLTDGQDSEAADVARFQERIRAADEALQDSDHIFLPVGIGEADDTLLTHFAGLCGTTYQRAATAEELEALYIAIGRELAGSMRLSFVAPKDAPAGAALSYNLRVEGYNQPVPVSFTVPDRKTLPDTARELQLVVRLTEGGKGSQVFTRTLQDLSNGFNPWELIASHHLGFAVHMLPSRVCMARKLDELIDQYWLKQLRSGQSASPVFSIARGMSTDTVLTIHHALALTTGALDGKTGPAWRGPALWLASQRMHLREEDDEMLRLRGLDFLQFPFGPADNATRWQRMQCGLALGSVEANLLGTPSVNNALGAVDKLEWFTPAPARATSLAQDIHNNGGLLLHVKNNARVAWGIPLNGELKVIAQLRAMEAKGALVEETAKGFKEIREMLKLLGAIGSGVLYAAGSPNSALYNALLNLWDEEMKLWCYSSVMLALIAEGIEEDEFDAENAQEIAKEKCELKGDPNTFGINIAIAFGTGYISGEPEDVASDFLMGFIGGSNPWVQILVGTATSYWDPIPDGKDVLIDVATGIIR